MHKFASAFYLVPSRKFAPVIQCHLVQRRNPVKHMVHMRSDGANFVLNLSEGVVHYFIVKIFDRFIQLMNRMDNQVLYSKNN